MNIPQTDAESIAKRLIAELEQTRYGDVVLTVKMHEHKIVRWDIKREVASDRMIQGYPDNV